MGGGPGYHPCPRLLLGPSARPQAGRSLYISEPQFHNMGMMITPKPFHLSIVQMSQ